jgi:hypothetical protein
MLLEQSPGVIAGPCAPPASKLASERASRPESPPSSWQPVQRCRIGRTSAV